MNDNKKLLQFLSDDETNFHCLLDIDNFRCFNINNSFEKGNEVLLQISKIAKTILKPKYWLYVGSDEFFFSIKIERIEDSSLFEFMQKIYDDLSITISIGVIENSSKIQIRQKYKLLQINVVKAKENGKNLVYII